MSFPEAIDIKRLRSPDLSKLRGVKLPKFHRPSRLQVLIAFVCTLIALVGAFFLVRDSSLVKVEEVQVVGLGGYYDRAARKAVTAEALQMTTMNFDEDRIRDAAGAFVNVADVTVVTDFPHGVTLKFDVIRPVVAGKVNGRTVALAADGSIIAGASNLSTLPTIDVSGVISGNRVTDGKALGAVKVLGAAPDVLLRKVEEARWGRNGLTLELEKGVLLYFGTAEDIRAKWRDAVAVLASSETAGLSYIDLRAPGRPSVGGLGPAPVTITPGAADALPALSLDPATAGSTAATGDQQTQLQAPQEQSTPAPVQAPAQPQPATPTPPPAGGASPQG